MLIIQLRTTLDSTAIQPGMSVILISSDFCNLQEIIFVTVTGHSVYQYLCLCLGLVLQIDNEFLDPDFVFLRIRVQLVYGD